MKSTMKRINNKDKNILSKKNTDHKSKFTRHNFLLFCFVVLFSALSIRLYLLQIDNLFLKKQGDMRTVRAVKVPAYRGMITDRNKEPLAISTVIFSIWANPKNIEINDEKLVELSDILEMEYEHLKDKILESKDKEFIYLKRHVSPAMTNKVQELDISGVQVKEESRRFYPEGEVAAHIVGFTGIDDNGQEGVELSYNTWLHGEDGQKIIIKDRLGRVIKDNTEVKPVQNGNDLVLSIDSRIQYLAYRELFQAVKKHKAKSGSIVVLDVKTGEVLAMVNQPSYNPNKRAKKVDGSYRNRAVTDLFEPGSVMKTFSMVNILENGEYLDDMLIDTNPGTMQVGKNIVRDTKNNGVIDISEVLVKSSNIGISKLTLGLDKPDSLYHLLSNLGFGESVTIEFPGESQGVLRNYTKWDPFVLSTMAFGYSLSCTALQLAQAYATLANDGVKLPVSFLKVDKDRIDSLKGEQIINKDVAEEVTKMLTKVGQQGVHGRARVKGYKVAGKSGTSKKLGAHGYEDRYHSLFAGFAPASDPKIVVVIMIDEPSAGQYYGSLVAAPVFSKVMSGVLRTLNVPVTNYVKNN